MIITPPVSIIIMDKSVIMMPLKDTNIIKHDNKPIIDYSNTCSICNNDYNKTKHRKILCYCNLDICLTCIKTYILSKDEFPHCYNCNIEWNREYMIKNITKSWVNNEYTEHHKNILFKQEELQFQETISYIEDEKIKERNVHEIRMQVDNIRILMIPLYKQIKEYQKEIETLNDNIDN